MTVLTLAAGACVAPKPGQADLNQAAAGPVASIDMILGQYDDAEEGRPTVSLWTTLSGKSGRFDPTTRPTGERVVHIATADNQLTAELFVHGVAVERQTLPFTLKNDYVRGGYSRVGSGPCVPAAYEASGLTLGRRGDGALVVVCTGQRWMLFPIPGWTGGAGKPWVNTFRRVDVVSTTNPN